MSKFIQKTIVFFLLFLALNFCYLFTIQKLDWNFSKRLEALNLENPTYEVLVLGNSLAMDGIDTGLMTENGYPAYNLSIGGSSIATNIIQLEEYLAAYEHKPRYVIVGQATYTGFLNSSTIHPLVDFTTPGKFYDLYDLPMLKFKWMFTDNLKMLVSKPHRDAYLVQGQLKFDKTVPDNTSLVADNELNLAKYLDDKDLPELIELCSENDIQLYFLEMPGFRNERHPRTFTCKVLDENRNNGFLIDYNTVEFGESFNPEEDWIGNDHLNEKGAKKFTRQLVRDIFVEDICASDTGMRVND